MASTLNTLGFVLAVIGVPSTLVIFYNVFIWLSPRRRYEKLHVRLEYARTLVGIIQEQGDHSPPLLLLQRFISYVMILSSPEATECTLTVHCFFEHEGWKRFCVPYSSEHTLPDQRFKKFVASRAEYHCSLLTQIRMLSI